MALGDVDGDGDPDLATVPTRLYRNNGEGSFTDVTASCLPPNGTGSQVIVGDVDGDGHVDLVYGNITQNLLYVNDGTGTFTDVTAARMPVGGSRCIASGDIDGDSDLDLVVVGSVNRLFLNDGTGTYFEDVNLQAPLGFFGGPCGAALGDVDGDADLDLLLAEAFGNHLYLNDGTGSFQEVTAAQLPAVAASSSSVVLGDIDGDGDLDFVSGGYFYTPSRLYRNNGTGTFTDITTAGLPIGQQGASSVALGDLDGDGDLDLVCANWSREVAVNDGSGSFANVTGTMLPANVGYEMCTLLGDVDVDGDLDVLFGSYAGGLPSSGGCTPGWSTSGACVGCPPCPGQNELLFNLQRQLHAPLAPRIGQPWTLDAHVRYAPPTNHVAAIFLSTTRIHVPVPPFGVLGIDPMAPLPLVTIPSGSGTGTTSWTVPNLPQAIGVTIHAQALFVTATSLDRLSNVVTTVIAL